MSLINETSHVEFDTNRQIKHLEDLIDKLIQRNELLINRITTYKRRINELEGEGRVNNATDNKQTKDRLNRLVVAVDECLEITQNMIDNHAR